MPKQPAKKRYPNIEPKGDGWRATLRIDGELHKGKKRSTQLDANYDAKGLQDLRDSGNVDAVNSSLGDAIKRVLGLCELQRRRAGMVCWYEQQFTTLKAEFGEGQKLRLLTKSRVQEFVSSRVKKGVSARTVRHNLQALRRLFRVSELVPPLANIALPDLEETSPDVFEWKDATKMLDRVRRADEFEWAVFALFLYNGVRRAEAARIRIVDDENDIDWGQKLLHVKIGKRRPRTLPCPDQLIEVLTVFNDESKRPKFDEGDEDGAGDGLLPGSTEARRIGYLRRVFERWSATLKQPKLHPHALRHTFGSELARKGVSEATIAVLMGHTLSAGGARAITHRYITVHGPEARAAMEKLWE